MAVGKPEITVPLESRIFSPEISVIVPSVARIGETPTQAISAPLSVPIATATAAPASSASTRNSGLSGWVTIIAAITSEQAFAPAIIDRLMPPVSMVMPIPRASMPRIGSCEPIDWKLATLKKRLPSRAEKTRATTTIITHCRRMMASPGKNLAIVFISKLPCQFAFFVPGRGANADQDNGAAEHGVPV